MQQKNVMQMTFFLWTVNVCAGLLVFTLASLSGPIMQEFNITSVQLGFVMSLPTLIIALLNTIPGMIVDKIGVYKAATLTFSALLAAGTIMSFAKSWQVVIAMIVIMSFCVAITSPMSGALVSNMSSVAKERMLGIITTGMSIGIMSTHGLAIRIMYLTNSSWRVVIRIFVAALIAISLIGINLFKKMDIKFEPKKNTQKAEQLSRVNIDKKKRRLFIVCICGIYFGTTAVSLGLNNWLPTIITSKGVGELVAANSASLFSLGSFLVVIIAPFLFAELAGKKFTLTIVTVILTISIVLLGSLMIPGWIYFAVIVCGCCCGYSTLVAQCKLIEISDPDKIGRYVSWGYSIGNLGAMISINGIGVIEELSGKITFVVIFCIVAVVSSFILTRRKENVYSCLKTNII